MLEVRRMMAADMPFAGDVLDQELDAPSDQLSMTMSTASTEWSGSGAVETRIDASINQSNADAETAVDSRAADQLFDLAGDHNADGVVDHDDYLDWKANFGTVGSPAAGNGGVVDAAAYVIWRDNLGASTVASPSDSYNAPGSLSDDPVEDVSINLDDDGNAIETPLDAAIADPVPQPPVDTSLADETPVDTDVIDQALEIEGSAAEDLDTSSPVVSPAESESKAGDATQPSIDAGADGFPGGLLETEPGVETTGPEDTDIVFGDMEYDDVKTKDDIPDLRKVSYGKYEAARALGDSHEKAAKAAGVEADGKWGKIFKRVYENDN
jgi:hypothetical protein